METFEYGNNTITLDDDGYLANFDSWNESMACGLAEHEGIDELTSDRMDILKFMRDYYIEYKSFPILGAVCKNVHLARDCVQEDFLDPVKAWKIAGLPKPSEEVISYLKR